MNTSYEEKCVEIEGKREDDLNEDYMIGMLVLTEMLRKRGNKVRKLIDNHEYDKAIDLINGFQTLSMESVEVQRIIRKVRFQMVLQQTLGKNVKLSKLVKKAL